MAEFRTEETRVGVHWFSLPRNPATEVGGFPEWLRSAGLGLDGIVYVPTGILLGMEREALFRAAIDEQAVIVYLGHYYIDIEWLAQVYPETAGYCAAVAAGIKAELARKGGLN